MSSHTRSPVAGGALIALGCMIGAAAGLARHQPTIGLLIGLGAGVVLSLLIWWRDRGR